MLSITVPLWLMMILIGVPTLSLASLMIALWRMRKGRRSRRSGEIKEHPILSAQPASFNTDMEHTILGMQIDAVFQSLSMIIETERVKLKAMIGIQVAGAQPAADRRQDHPVSPDAFGAAAFKNSAFASEEPAGHGDISEKIAAQAANGVTPKTIARELGLSLAEVVLALRMQQTGGRPRTGLGRQLEAVA